MILNCKECKTSFNFPENLIKESGTKVRCSKCHHVFVAYPAAAAKRDEKLAGIEDSALDEVAGLNGVDLNEIEDMLDSTVEQKVQSASADSDGELDLDFDLDLTDDEGPVADMSGVELEETEELDLSDLDLDETSEESGGLTESMEDMDFTVDLDMKQDTAEETSSEERSDATEELDFELDLGSEMDTAAETAASEIEEQAAESSDGLDFELDLDLEDEEELDDAASELDLEQSHDLDVTGMEDLIDLEGDQPPTDDASAESDELDFELDLEPDLESATESAMEEPESKADDALDDFDFELDSETDAADSAATAPAEVEETAELDLSDLEDMTEVEEESGAGAEAGGAAEELDFELELESEAELTSEADGWKKEYDATEEFDFSDLDKMLDEDEETEKEAKSAEEMSELDLNLELADEDSADAVSDAGIEATAEFDLSDLENVLEMEDESAAAGTEAVVDDIDLAMDDQQVAETGDVLFEGDESADVELEFDIEDNVVASHSTADTAATVAAAAGGNGLAETFDMGTLTDGDETMEEGDGHVPYEMMDEETLSGRTAPKPAEKRRLSGPFRILLLLVLLGGGGYAAHSVSESMGIKIPFLSQIKSIRIPFVSDLFAPKVEDPGNLNIRILASKVDGWFVENKKVGTLFVVRGQVRNNYNHPRNFIKITGKIYSKRKQHSGAQTVYAGNVLSDKDLASLDLATINQRLNYRFGANRSNLKIKTGKVIPFMIVFSKLPPNPDEYTVQVNSSTKGKV